MARTKIPFPPRPQLQQAWEFAPRAGDTPIRRPAGLNLPKAQVLPNQVWRAAGDEAELARFTVVLS
jgi:hypothetical protein